MRRRRRRAARDGRRGTGLGCSDCRMGKRSRRSRSRGIASDMSDTVTGRLVWRPGRSSVGISRSEKSGAVSGDAGGKREGETPADRSATIFLAPVAIWRALKSRGGRGVSICSCLPMVFPIASWPLETVESSLICCVLARTTSSLVHWCHNRGTVGWRTEQARHATLASGGSRTGFCRLHRALTTPANVIFSTTGHRRPQATFP